MCLPSGPLPSCAEGETNIKMTTLKMAEYSAYQDKSIRYTVWSKQEESNIPTGREKSLWKAGLCTWGEAAWIMTLQGPSAPGALLH